MTSLSVLRASRAPLAAGIQSLALGLFLCSPASAHVVLDEPAALAGQGYKAALRIGHGCEGSPTTAVTVTLPAGFSGAKPQPKPGWTVAIRVEKLARPLESHGRRITEDVTALSWTATAREHWLPDSHFDEFVLRGTLPAREGPLWFKVLQVCEQGSIDWSEIPASPAAAHGLKRPAALLEVLPSGRTGHAH